jgi:uncharacterized protein YggE
MNQTLKSVVGAAVGLAVLAVGYSAVSYVNSYGKSIQPSSFRSFSVSGDGKSINAPDIAEFSFQVITEGGNDLTALQKQNTDSANKVIAFVKSEGVADKDIQTEYYNVNPRYTSYGCYDAPVSSTPTMMRGTVSSGSGSSGSSTGVMVTPPVAPSSTTVKTCPPPSIVGYTVTQSVSVKMRDFTKVGDIVGGVVTNGANQVGSLTFTLDDPSKAQDAARGQAIEKAKAKAESVAQAGGFSLGRLLNIQENGNNPYPMYKSYSMDSGIAAPTSVPAPSIQPGSQETKVTVTMTYEIK